jgi:hypothetical protein
MKMNLFLSTQKLTDQREDHLTEFFAAALTISEPLRRNFYELAIAPYARLKKWGDSQILSVETQACYDGTNCRPDLRFQLSDGRKILCENKLNAPETPGSEADDRLQLERYLDLPEIDGLLYIRSGIHPPGEKVLSHPKYIRPVARQHFLWRDFYPIFDGVTDPLLVWIRDGFEHLGFVPPHPSCLSMENEAGLRDFAKLWGTTRSCASKLGWDSETNKFAQLYLNSTKQSAVEAILVQPTPRGFLIRISPGDGRAETCFSLARHACESYPHPLIQESKQIRRGIGKVEVFHLEVSAKDLLGLSPRTTDEVEKSLSEFVLHFLNAISS